MTNTNDNKHIQEVGDPNPLIRVSDKEFRLAQASEVRDGEIYWMRTDQSDAEASVAIPASEDLELELFGRRGEPFAYFKQFRMVDANQVRHLLIAGNEQ